MHVAFGASEVKDLDTTNTLFFILLNIQLFVCQSKPAAATPRGNSGLLSVHQTPLRLAPKLYFHSRRRKSEKRVVGVSDSDCYRLVAPLLLQESLFFFSFSFLSLFSPRAATSAHAGLPPGNVSLSFPV